MIFQISPKLSVAEVTFPSLPQPKLVLDLATPEGCKAELSCHLLMHSFRLSEASVTAGALWHTAQVLNTGRTIQQLCSVLQCK